MTDGVDKAREEFLSEAQEIIESLSRNLLTIDETAKAGGSEPGLVNEAFRAVHTLKGLAGLFGATTMGKLAHRLEDMLDALRLGRMNLDPAVLDLLFQAVDVFGRLVHAERAGEAGKALGVEELLKRIGEIGKEAGPQPPLLEYELDPSMLAVLSEYEEHRLTTNMQAGLRLYRLRVQFDLATIDTELERIKERAKGYGEIITYLPTGESSGPDTIDLDLLVASPLDLATVTEALGGERVVLEEVPRRQAKATVTPKLTAAQATAASAQQPRPASIPAALSAPAAAAVPAPAEAVLAQETTLRSATQTVRVDIRRLDALMNIVGELAIVRTSLQRLADRLRGEGQRKLATELQRLGFNFDRRLTEMQDGILEVRMVPLAQIFDRLARVVRQISRDTHKEIRLVITGAETEIDKLIVEELSDPLMHMIRNAIDHGIEAAAERAELGKPAAGTIALNAFHKGNHVVLEVEDDGRGIDEQALLARAVALNKLREEEARDLTRDDLLALIFLPGLSTRAEPGDTSGRGVGMDVVKTNVSRLGGVIDVYSERGIGTKMSVTLPITLAIVRALLVRVGNCTFAIPLNGVSEVLLFSERGVREVDGREVMTLRGATLTMCHLDRLLELDQESEPLRRRFVVVISVGARRLGLVVDHLIGQQDIVIKPLGRSLDQVRGFAGATELGDQHVALVLDAAALIEEVVASAETGAATLRRLHG
jgi:two-component system chemotaxis sensor kinase CheA